MQSKREVVVITGASAGVGRATARAFGKRQAKVGLIARGRDGLEAAKLEIEAAGGQALVLPLDVSDHDAVALRLLSDHGDAAGGVSPRH
jgi:NADP-dependent 3-hydroxy acid dehydrogenase YdfG